MVNDFRPFGQTMAKLSTSSKTIEVITKGQDRILLVMATGTGKTYTAFQIIWRLWKAKRKKRILYLADRNVLIDQTMVNDFRPFGQTMAKLSTSSKTIEREDGNLVDLPVAVDKKHRRIDTSYVIYLALYQAITGPEEGQKLFRELSRDFFDLIVIDECHRGSAAEDSAWRLADVTASKKPYMNCSPRCISELPRAASHDVPQITIVPLHNTQTAPIYKGERSRPLLNLASGVF